MPALDEAGDEVDDLVHRLCHLREAVDLVEPEPADVIEVPLGRLSGAGSARFRRSFVDLVVDVGDVVDAPDDEASVRPTSR